MALSKEACARASSIEGTRNGCLGGVVVEPQGTRERAAVLLRGLAGRRIRLPIALPHNSESQNHTTLSDRQSSELRAARPYLNVKSGHAG